MPNYSRAVAVPVFRPLASAQWVADASGLILSASGDGWDLAGIDPASLIGGRVQELPCFVETQIAALFTDVFRTKQAHHHACVYEGVAWRIELTPVPVGAGRYVCACLAVAVEQERDEPVDDPVCDEFEVAGDCGPLAVWGGDRWMVPDGDGPVLQMRLRSRRDFEEMRTVMGDRLHLTRRQPRPVSLRLLA